MNFKLANRIRRILDQENIPHTFQYINPPDDIDIHWVKLSEGPDVEVLDFGTINSKTKLSDLPFGD
jgi:hypothetical protein